MKSGRQNRGVTDLWVKQAATGEQTYFNRAHANLWSHGAPRQMPDCHPSANSTRFGRRIDHRNFRDGPLSWKDLTSPRRWPKVNRDRLLIRGHRKILSKDIIGYGRVVAPVRMDLYHPGKGDVTAPHG